MSCCRHSPKRHSADAGGCLECRCLWLPMPDARATYNPRGRYAEEFWNEHERTDGINFIGQPLVKESFPPGWGPEMIGVHQIAVYVMCGGGLLGHFAAEQPADFYIDDRVSRLPYRRSEIYRAVDTLAKIAQARGLNPHGLPPMPLLHSFGIL